MNLIDVSNIVELLRLIKDGADYSVTVGTDRAYDIAKKAIAIAMMEAKDQPHV
jgi:hypothetical protein